MQMSRCALEKYNMSHKYNYLYRQLIQTLCKAYGIDSIGIVSLFGSKETIFRRDKTNQNYTIPIRYNIIQPVLKKT